MLPILSSEGNAATRVRGVGGGNRVCAETQKGKGITALSHVDPLRKKRSNKGVRSRCEEQCYARKGKKGKASLPSPFQFYCSGNPYYQVASCIAFCSKHPFAHRKVPFTEQQMHPSAETLFGFPLFCPMRWLLQSYYTFGETATGSG